MQQILNQWSWGMLLTVFCSTAKLSFGAEIPTTELSVDTQDRLAVMAFWNRYYTSSSDADEVMDWTGNYAICSPGTVSVAYIEKIERRINFFRAMAGVHADTLVNTGSTVVIGTTDPYKPSVSDTKQEAAEIAAVMFSWAGQISHEPPPALPYSCWTLAAWNAAYRSNLAIGYHGPDAVDAYLREEEKGVISNPTAGHRRWLLNQGSTDFATGNTPGNGTDTLLPTNVLYVIQSPSEQVSYEPKYVPWPSAGFFPDALMTRLWSLSHPNADFSKATVTMTGPDGEIAATITDQELLGQGAPTLVWSIPSEWAETDVDADQVFTVHVDGIEILGETESYSYEVTVFDPDELGMEQPLTGTATPPLTGANYHFQAIPAADAQGVDVLTTSSADWEEGAENGTMEFIEDGTDDTYELSVSNFKKSGSRSFRMRLTLPSGSGLPPSQTLSILRETITGSGSKLKYFLKRGYMGSGEYLDVEVSHDQSNWTVVDSVVGNNAVDANFSARNIDLEEGESVWIRFVLRYASGSIYTGNDNRIGCFIDDISISNADWVTAKSTLLPSSHADSVRLDEETLGEAPWVGMQRGLVPWTELGGRKYPSPISHSVTFVEAVGGFGEWIAADYPTASGAFEGDLDGDGLSDGLEYALSTNPSEPGVLTSEVSMFDSVIRLELPLAELKEDVDYRMEISTDLQEWSDTGASVLWTDDLLIGECFVESPAVYARWAIEPK
ncbi:hypothetical protein HNR46_000747 [Haloferula luteola]|uniref:SCP domain-containing protein n=1 Tax=Haloferula luteola TaxID=595692 RepID=A0A840V9R4_9BACT|nr:thrombospondin type 3 repeat-containing protein [Haloferula luteola]MBB5350519.1 hypothetical protein [Haloferula luteola]